MSAGPRRHRSDPGTLLASAFERIYRERMADVPIVNPALNVEASGFRMYEGHWLGVMISPWFMNLVRVPGPEADWVSVQGETRQFQALPSGTYAFLGSEEPEVGEFQSCSLISPMGQFGDMDAARATATEVLAALLQTPVSAPEAVPAPGPNLLNIRRPAAAGEDSPQVDPPARGPDQGMSKREFLLGGLRRR
ncbi:Hydrogenase-2 operon protein HybE [Burkholderiales bacterium]|nr:Hydrogenase-2 operon protein HybE [Burkholderiales bacterium]